MTREGRLLLTARSWSASSDLKRRSGNGKTLTQHIAYTQGLAPLSWGSSWLRRVPGNKGVPVTVAAHPHCHFGSCPQGYLGCQALSEMIQFYLVEVMPKAENHDPDIKEHVSSLGEKLKTLRLRLRRCVSSKLRLSLAVLSIYLPYPAGPGKAKGAHRPRPSGLAVNSEGRQSLISCSFLSKQGWGWLPGIYM